MRLHPLASQLRFVALGGLSLVMGACTHANDGVSLEQSVPSKNAGMMALAPDRGHRPLGRPIVSLPGEQVASMREHGYVDGLRQDILLKGGAVRGIQNSITILARTSRQETLDERVPLVRPSEPQIRSEIGGAFPHLQMQIAERESSNAYGPYGLALGRADGDVRCTYMWQWIDENRLPADAALAGPISIRVRLCQAGVSFDQMASEMDHLTIGAQAGGEQIAAIAPLGVIEAPAEARQPVPHARKVPHRVATHHVRRPTRLTRHEEPAAAPAEFASSPRYMGAAPVSQPVAAPVYPQTATATPKLSGDLPAQAYMGPSAASAAANKPTAAKYY